MTADMMSLRALLEKSSDVDLLREMIGYPALRSEDREIRLIPITRPLCRRAAARRAARAKSGTPNRVPTSSLC
jgi:hypothetical protein